MVMQEAKTYQAYYTKSAPILDFMVSSLDLQSSDHVLEPCGGDGVFVDKILNLFPAIRFDVFELNQLAYSHLAAKYKHNDNISVFHSDTLLEERLSFLAQFGGHYDKIIANPPYGAWQDYEKRDWLKKQYDGIYVKDSYALFLHRCIGLLKEGGKLAFIIPDTFLNLHMHKGLRQTILTRSKIESISLFPSSFFPNISFGYANLCVLVLEKCSDRKACLAHSFMVRKGFESVYELSSENIDREYFEQRAIFENQDCSFIVHHISAAFIKNARLCMGDIADCVTGFYSGNDKAYLKTSSTTHRNAKNYASINPGEISHEALLPGHLEGIDDCAAHFIPIVKGGNSRFFKPDEWFINWSKSAVQHFKTDKKARFQNSKYYFRQGIAIPMVSASSITAAMLDKRLFDQSIVAVFPKDEKLTNYLLAFFNSPIANELIRAINPSTNNSANYIKKIPFVMPSEYDLNRVEILTAQILKECRYFGRFNPAKHEEINNIIAKTYSHG